MPSAPTGSDTPKRFRRGLWLGLGAAGAAAVAGTIIALWPRGGGGDGGERDSEDGPVVLSSARAEWQRLDDPAAEGWDSEVASASVKKQLDALAGILTGGGADMAGPLSALVAGSFSATALVPAEMETLRDAGGVKVVAGLGSGELVRHGVDGLHSALSAMLQALGSGGEHRCAFKIIDVRTDGDVVTTRQLIELSGFGTSGISELHAEWTIGWEFASRDDTAPRMKSLALERFEQTTSGNASPMFSDCTESALAGNSSYAKQILRGANHWLPRIQDNRKMALLWTPGTALGDVNGDGMDDLYLCQAGGLPNRLYVQQADGSVRDVTGESGTGWLESSRSALLVDLDNDGDRDLAVVIYGGVVLAANDGSGRFKVAAVLEARIGTMSLCAADYDGDGDLDLYAGAYSAEDLRHEAGATVIGSAGAFVYHDANNGGSNQLFRNDIGGAATGWNFTDATAETGLDVNNSRFTLAAAWEDYDEDGDQDLYVANDFGRNNLYRNDGGRFTDVAATTTSEDRASGMSVSWGDVNRDGRMDLYVGNMFSAAGNRIVPKSAFSPGSTAEVRSALLRFARGNTMLVQADAGFTDISESAGVTMGRWAWSSLFADLDNDGWEDLVVANGYITTPDEGDL